MSSDDATGMDSPRFLATPTDEAIFCPVTLKLGEIHYLILWAERLMDSRRFVNPNSSLKFTEFGEEVEVDEIHWWVFKKDPNPEELRRRTERALEAAQVLKDKSAKLKDVRLDSYEELLSILKEFAEQCSGEIETLRAYVSWLETLDPMAPRILFTYRVWGSTRMSDRRIQPFNAGAPLTPDASILKTATQIVLGIRGSRLWNYDRAYFDIIEQYMDYEGDLEIHDSQIAPRAARYIFEECAIYFSEIRDSLRNILLDLQKCRNQRNLMRSEIFWREFIEKAARDTRTEQQLWDFKETLTMWHISTQPEKDKAKLTFAEDVASFANATGGVLVIGVTDQRQIVGGGSSHELENRVKFARDVIAKQIKYPREITSFQQVVLASKTKIRYASLLLLLSLIELWESWIRMVDIPIQCVGKRA